MFYGVPKFSSAPAFFYTLTGCAAHRAGLRWTSPEKCNPVGWKGSLSEWKQGLQVSAHPSWEAQW